VWKCGERAESRDAEEVQALDRVALEIEGFERQRRDERGFATCRNDRPVGDVRRCVRDELVRRQAQAKRDRVEFGTDRERSANAPQPPRRIALDPAHLEQGESRPVVFDERRCGVERVECRFPEPCGYVM
jgi:hypothetical protein